MPSFAWYILIGLGLMVARFALALLFVRFVPSVRPLVKLSAGSFISALLTWPVDMPFIVIGSTVIITKALLLWWSVARTAKRMNREVQP